MRDKLESIKRESSHRTGSVGNTGLAEGGAVGDDVGPDEGEPVGLFMKQCVSCR